MRFLTIILSLTILFLSLKPCSDGQNLEHKHKDEISMNHNHQEDSSDSCSTICICSCCGITITDITIESYHLKGCPTDFVEIVSSYHPNYRFDYYTSIWQPPQGIS